MSATDKSKLDGIAAGAQVNTITGVKGDSEESYRTGNINLTKANIGLGNVNNTADADKPISTAAQTALNKKFDNATTTGTGNVISSVSISGTTITFNKGITAHQAIYALTIQGNGTTLDTYTPNTAAKVINITAASVGAAASTHSHSITDVTNLQSTLNGKAAASHTHSATDITSGTFSTAQFADLSVTSAKIANLNVTTDKIAAGAVTEAKLADGSVTKVKLGTDVDLDSKADKVHTHNISDVTDLQATLNGKAAASHTHKMSEITDLDIPTYETLTLTVTAEDGSSVTGQKATINGEVYPLDSTGIVVAKIPYGVEYKIILNSRKNCTTPTIETYLAALKSRSVTIQYKTLGLGVYIMDIDDGIFNIDDWDKGNNNKAEGIVISTSDKAFLMALNDYTSQISYSDSYTTPFEKTCISIAKETDAKVDFNGAENTENALKTQSGANYFAYNALNYKFPSGRRSGHIPSGGEGWAVIQNFEQVTKAIEKCGGELFKDYYYYACSTFYGLRSDNRYFWLFCFKITDILPLGQFSNQLGVADTCCLRYFGNI